jgi:hypothetical protein
MAGIPPRAPRVALPRSLPVLIVLSLVIMACGLDGHGVSTATPPPPFTPNPTPDPSAAVPLNAASGMDLQANGDPKGLHIQLVGLPLQLEGNAFGTAAGNPAESPNPLLGITCSPWLALADPSPDQTTYTAADLNEITTYITAQADAVGDRSPTPDARAALPHTLRWVAGSVGADADAVCRVQLQATNNTNASIALDAVDLQLAAAPVANPYHYSLIDICTVNPLPSRLTQACSPPGTGPGPCYYGAQIAMDAPTGSDGLIRGDIQLNRDVALDSPCPRSPLLPRRGDSTTINLYIAPPAGGASLIYTVRLALVLSDSLAPTPHAIVPQQRTSALVFARPNQFTCYGLRNGGFVSEGGTIGFSMTGLNTGDPHTRICV